MLANAVKSISECISITDMDDITLFVNDAFLKTYGYEREDLINKNINIVRSPNNPTSITEKILPTTIKGGWQGELLNRKKNGQDFPIHLSTSIINDENGKPIALIGISVDITEQKRLQHELQKIHRLESIGTLAGGIAHDFNNILVGILGNISLSKIYAKPNEKLFDKLNDIEIAALRAKELSNKLVTFARGGNPRKRISSISQFLKDTVHESLSGSNSTSEFSIRKDLWKVEYDETQMRQVINNIIINAVEAMPSGGKIKVRAENIILPADSGYSLPEGPYIKIMIKDHGIGIPEENLDRIFDPFFSTKFLGRGIGLSTTYSIIKRHNGYISVDSVLGKETTFHILIPAQTQKTEKFPDKKTQQNLDYNKKGKILVMDDEAIVREFVDEFLTYSGYEIGLAKDGEEAIKLFKDAKDSPNPFEIVILDLTVPQNLGAKETLQKLLEIDPNIKAIVSSGYSDDEVILNYKNYGFIAALIKPFKIDEIQLVLGNILNANTKP
jgi:PAS domain S-box-containing protein